MKKYISIIASFVTIFTGCQSEVTDIVTINGPEFQATVESFEDATRTSMTTDRKIIWSKGDLLAVFQGRTMADKYRLTDQTAGTGQGKFSIVSQGDNDSSSELDGAPNIAFYPFMESLVCSNSGASSYSISNVNIPAVQSYVSDSFGNGAFQMAAVTGDVTDHSLRFKNVMGAMKLQLTGSETIRSIRIEGKNSEKLSGSATITVHTDGRTPSIAMSETSSTSVILDCGNGVKLSQRTPTSFIIALPPVRFSKGFKVTITNSDNISKVIQTSVGTNEVLRSSILVMPGIDLSTVKGEFEELVHTTLTESDRDIANPERGFYYARSTTYPLSKTHVQAARLQNVTIFHIGYLITDYIESYIADSFLQRIRTEMQILRDNGAKCILRFSYKDSAGEEDKPWDATPEWVDRHIQQLKPILQEYGDVIMCFQAGFVGVWGEWYYTSNFISSPSTPQEHSLRKNVVDAMLDALPSDRMVALRTPAFKRMMYAESYTDTLTIATAYNGSARARISCYNDCFGASSSDYGTFNGEETREYWKKETRYVLMGGETCGVSSYCTCNASLKDMEDYHWSYLNNDYHKDVIAGWENGGCLDEIKRRLGYRLSLTDIYHSRSLTPGENFNIVLKIKNTGFAAPMNGRAVELIMVDGNGHKTVWECPDIDPRYWFAGETVTIDKTVKIPADATGECTLYLNLPDPKTTLHDNPLFSIRLANDGIWMEEEGYNKLFFLPAAEESDNPEQEPEPGENPGSTSATGENLIHGSEFNPW